MEILRVCLSDTDKLPDKLLGRSIQIITRKGETWVSTVVEFLVHRADFVLVRDSGKLADAV